MYLKDAAVVLPWIIAAILWTRGLWRGSVGDCVGCICIATLWTVLMTMQTGTTSGLNALGAFMMLAAVLACAVSLIASARIEVAKNDMRTVIVALLIVGFLLTTLL